MGQDDSVHRPGRLGDDPEMCLKKDPRTDERLRAMLGQLQMDGNSPKPAESQISLQQIVKEAQASELQYKGLMEMLFSTSAVEGVTESQETIKGVDGNDIVLYISKPANVPTDTCVYFTHGGGMMILDAAYPNYRSWCNRLSALGLVVVSPEFRNAAGNRVPPAPYPAGLNDCVSGLKWVVENKTKLGVSKIVMHGESGGGNLALATTMKAATEGIKVNGVYACCPYISNMWTEGHPGAKQLVSLVENDGYFINVASMAQWGRVYTEQNTPEATDGFAWPFHATDEQLKTLPATVISVNDLDPLRDEGLVFSQRLRSVGVGGHTVTLAGTTHAADLMFCNAIPDIAIPTLEGVKAFCARVD